MFSESLSLPLAEHQGIHLHLLEHGQQTIGTCWGEMFPQTNLLNEIKVGIKYILRRLVVEHTKQQGHNALNYQCIALGLELHLAIHQVCLKPHTALATVYQVLLGLVLHRQFRLVAAHVYEQLITVHPVVKVLELFNYLVLYLVYCHNAYFSL